MTNMIILLVFSLLVACGPYSPYVDSKLKPYISTYASYKLKYSNKYYDGQVSAMFLDIEPPTVATCTTYAGNYRIIRVDPRYWKDANELDKEILILHEMGHCDLDLDHTARNTIMNPELLPDYKYAGNKELLLDYLFNYGY